MEENELKEELVPNNQEETQNNDQGVSEQTLQELINITSAKFTDAHKKKRGIGYTRKNKEESKKAKKSAKLQRRKNRKISNKKFRPSGSKKRK